MRLGFSQLNSDLFLRGCVDSRECRCLNSNESQVHYFLQCPLLHDLTEELFSSLNNLFLSGRLSQNIGVLPNVQLTAALISGHAELSVYENTLLFKLSQKFIVASERFSD